MNKDINTLLQELHTIQSKKNEIPHLEYFLKLKNIRKKLTEEINDVPLSKEQSVKYENELISLLSQKAV